MPLINAGGKKSVVNKTLSTLFPGAIWGVSSRQINANYHGVTYELGTGVSSWKDQFGSEDFIQGNTSKQPTLSDINGVPALNFDHTASQELNSGTFTPTNNIGSYTVSIVANLPSDGNQGYILHLGDGIANSGARINIEKSGTGQSRIVIKRLDADSDIFSPWVGAAGNQVLTLVRNSQISTDSATLYLDGQVGTSVDIPAGLISPTDSKRSATGSKNGAQFVTCKIGEVILWGYAFSSRQINQYYENASNAFSMTAAPSFTVNPSVTVTGSTTVIAECDPGTFIGFPTPTALYQWYLGGVLQTGQTGKTYQYTGGTTGATLKCNVKLVNTSGTVNQDSNDIAVGGFEIILMAGQSNMTGRGTPIDLVTLDAPDATVWQLGLNDTIATLGSDPFKDYDVDTPAVGQYLSFAKAYKAGQSPTKYILIVPVADGATGFTDLTANSEWAPGGTHRIKLMERIQAAIALGGGVNEVKGFIWHQGEAENTAGVGVWGGYFDALTAEVRTTVGNSSLPVVVGQVLQSFGSATLEAEISGTPTRLSNAGFYDSNGLVGFDGVHFTAAEIRTMGTRAYTAWVSATTDP